jgi:hypothetical protein
MSVTVDELLTRLNREAPPGSRKRFQALLEEGSTASFAVKPVRGKADETLRLWETRLKTSRLPSRSLKGIRSFVERLRAIPPEADIEQFGFTGKRFAGSVFFDRASGKFLGDTIVERHGKSQEMVEVEAQLFQSSRKFA